MFTFKDQNNKCFKYFVGDETLKCSQSDYGYT